VAHAILEVVRRAHRETFSGRRPGHVRGPCREDAIDERIGSGRHRRRFFTCFLGDGLRATPCFVAREDCADPDTGVLLFDVLAAIAGFYLASEVQIGSPIIGNYALESIAAAVLGGASLAGGKGSFVGTLLAALFLTLIDNVLPLFQQPTEYAEMTIGVLILLALVLYSAPELLARFRTGRGGVGRLRTRSQGEAPAA